MRAPSVEAIADAGAEEKAQKTPSQMMVKEEITRSDVTGVSGEVGDKKPMPTYRFTKCKERLSIRRTASDARIKSVGGETVTDSCQNRDDSGCGQNPGDLVLGPYPLAPLEKVRYEQSDNIITPELRIRKRRRVVM